MIKVAMVSTIRPETNYTFYLIEALQKYYPNGVEVLVYTETENPQENLARPLKNINLVWDRNWRFVFQILRQVLKDKVQVIHFQHEINMYGGPRTAALFPLLVGLARLLGLRPVVTVHAVVPTQELNEEFLKVFEWPQPKIFSYLVRIIFPTIYFFIGLFAQKIIVHSPGLKETLVRDYFFNGKKIEVIPHGVPPDVRFQPPSVNPGLREKVEGRKFILYFGYLHRRKGLEFLVRAFKEISRKFPDYNLVIAGGTILPKYTGEIEGLVKQLGLEQKVTVTGFIELNDLRYLFDKCRFVALPAVYSIAASGPLAQVFAHGKAVIVSNLGVYREEIQDGVNGLLAKVGDVGDLSEKMESLVVSEELRRRIEENVRRLSKERSWEKIAGRTLSLYVNLAYEKG